MVTRQQGWANLRCSLLGHDWQHDGPKSWAMTCKRCGEHYYLPKIEAPHA